MRYAVVVEEGENSYGAYVPDLPGCIAAAKTKAEVLKLIREAIEFHIEGLREEGLPVPVPTSKIRCAGRPMPSAYKRSKKATGKPGRQRT